MATNQSGSVAQRGFIGALDNFGKNEPVLLGGAIAMLITAGLGVASSFGYVLEGEQVDSIFYLLTALIGVISVYQRSRVSPVSTVARIEAEAADEVRAAKLESAVATAELVSAGIAPGEAEPVDYVTKLPRSG